MRSQIRGRMALLLGAALLLASGVLGQASADDGTALAARFPTEIAGRSIDVLPTDGQTWIDSWSGDPASEGDVAALEAWIVAQERTPADLAVADAYIEIADDFAQIVAFQVPGTAATELGEVLLPLLATGYEDLRRTRLDVAGQSVEVISDGAPDMEFGWLLVLHPEGDTLWAVSGSGPGLVEVVEAVLVASAVPQLPQPSFEPDPVGPSASEVIREDVAAGVLDAATGLLYRIYAITGDPLLPERYAAYPAFDDDTAFDDAAFQFDTLPVEIQEAIAPYIVRPTDPRSIHNATEIAAAGGPALAALLTDQVPCTEGDWVRQASGSIPMVVWSRCHQGSADAGVAGTLAALEDLYPAIVRLMGVPIPDAGGEANGGDASIDVYLVSRLDPCPEDDARATCIGSDGVAVARTAPPFGDGPAATSSGYLVLDRARAAAGGPAFVADVAHELFHVFQAAYNRRGMVVPDVTNHWFVEASAVWAEHYFVPDARASQVYPRLQGFQRQHAGLTSTFGTREYNAYVWPYFMEQERGAVAIADAWRAIRGKVGEVALDEAIASVVPFDTRYREFAVRAWNAPLPADGGGDAIDPRFQALDHQMPPVKPSTERWTSETLAAQAKEAEPIEVPQWLDTLDHYYREYVPDEDVQQLVVDFSGLVPGRDLDVEALLRRRDGGWERRPLPDGETTFCLDPSGDDLDRLILVLANHSHLGEVDGTFTLRPLADPCAFWEGTMSETLRWNKAGASGEWTATFRGRWEPTPPGISYCDLDCMSFVPVGTVEWRSTSAFRTNGCSKADSGSLATGDVVVPRDQMFFLRRDDEDHLRYWGNGTLFGLATGCSMQDGTGNAGPSGFFWIDEAGPDAPRSDEGAGDRPMCGSVSWRIERGADQISGSCWLDDLPGFEHRVEWDLQRVGATATPDGP